jgi:hypothetical protein
MTNTPPDAICQAAQLMLGELKQRRLEVALVPAPRQIHRMHNIRVVADHNPGWYRHLCEQHWTQRSRPRRRKPKFTDTLIKRRQVRRSLECIASGQFNSTQYAERLMPYVERYARWLLEDPEGKSPPPYADKSHHYW